MNWREALPAARGRLVHDAELGPHTWLRVGGSADVLFFPEDEADLAGFLAELDPAVPVMTLGAASNVLVRDGGVEGVVVRLGKAFATIDALPGARVRAGAATLDAQLARAAARAGTAGLEFYSGVPGTVGGALAMNAGCYGGETRDVLVEAAALTRSGEAVVLSAAQMGHSYRSCQAAASGLVFVGALFQGRPDLPEAIEARMAAITRRREASQPVRERTGGSTFRNPGQESAWRLIDEAGWRGRAQGGAMFSPQHANFLINMGEATAADLEGLGETVRAEVLATRGVTLEWEIKRLGRPCASMSRTPPPPPSVVPLPRDAGED